jgi:hydrogenase expression/formation protein HypE
VARGGKVGKIDLETFESFLMGRLGRPSGQVLIGPHTGVDAAVLEVGDCCLVVAEDPIFPAIGLPLETFGWFTMHIGASDVAVLGVPPQFATYSLLMPPGTPDRDFETIVESIHQAALELDIAIVGGHTGYYPVVTVPIIGGITVLGTAAPSQIVSPAGSQPGDAVLLTKGPAIEATGLLALLYEAELRARYGVATAEAALARCTEITVVKDALTAVAAGAVSAMHDATEGGVLGGLYEMADAAGVGMEVEEAAMVWPADVEAVCELLSIDPLAAIAEGTLLLSVPQAEQHAVQAALEGEGIPCTRIGTVLEDPSRRVIVRRDGRTQDLAVPDEDPFWPAFFAGVAKLQEKA